MMPQLMFPSEPPPSVDSSSASQPTTRLLQPSKRVSIGPSSALTKARPRPPSSTLPRPPRNKHQSAVRPVAEDDIINLATLEVEVDRGVLRQAKPGSYAIGTWARPGAGAVRRRKGGGWEGAGLEIEYDDDEDEDEGVCWEERESSSDEDDDELSGFFEDPPSLAHRQERLRNQEERAELSAFHSDELRRRQTEAELEDDAAGELELPPEPGIELLAAAAGDDGSDDEMAIEPLGKAEPAVVRAASMVPLGPRTSLGTPEPKGKGRAQSVAAVGGSGGVGQAHRPSPLGAHPSTTAAIRTGLSRLNCSSIPEMTISDDDDDDGDTPTRPVRPTRSVSPDLLDLVRSRSAAKPATQPAPVFANTPSTSSPLRRMDIGLTSPATSSPGASRPPLSAASEDPLALADLPAPGSSRCVSAEAPLSNSPSRLLRDPTPYTRPAQVPTPPVSASTTVDSVSADDRGSTSSPAAPHPPARAPVHPHKPTSVQPTPQARRIRHSFALVIPVKPKQPLVKAGTLGRSQSHPSLAGRSAKSASPAVANPTPSPSPGPDDELLLTSFAVAVAVSPRKRGRVSGGSPELKGLDPVREDSVAPPFERVFGRRTSLCAGSQLPGSGLVERVVDDSPPRQPVRRLQAARSAPPRQRHSSVAVVRPPTPPSSRSAPGPAAAHRHSSPPKRRRSSVAPSSSSLFQPSSGSRSSRSTPGPFRLLGGVVKQEEAGELDDGLDDPLMLPMAVALKEESGRSSRRSSVGPGFGFGAETRVSGLVRSRSSPVVCARVEEESEDELALK